MSHLRKNFSHEPIPTGLIHLVIKYPIGKMKSDTPTIAFTISHKASDRFRNAKPKQINPRIMLITTKIGKDDLTLAEKEVELGGELFDSG